jgi:predicted nucleic acid-binding protein
MIIIADSSALVALSICRELEAIALYLKTSADLLLIDDAYAKKVAVKNGLEVMGSIGVLLLAKQKGLISTIKPLITMLVNSEIHLGNNVIQKALYLAKE